MSSSVLPILADRRLGARYCDAAARPALTAPHARRVTRDLELLAHPVRLQLLDLLARAAIDVSGTWRSPNPLGAGGVLADGEREAAAHVPYGIPDEAGRDRARPAAHEVARA